VAIAGIDPQPAGDEQRLVEAFEIGQLAVELRVAGRMREPQMRGNTRSRQQ